MTEETTAETGRPTAGIAVVAIVPVFNERASVGDVLDRLLECSWVSSVIAVDDGSTDGSSEILMRYASRERVSVIRHPGRRGKGAAIRTALGAADGDVVFIQDADLEYDPGDVPALLEPIIRDDADVVYGSRFLMVRRPKGTSLAHWIANRVLTWWSNLWTGQRLTDVMTGYKVFRADFFKALPLRSAGFAIEAEVTAYVARAGARISELPVSYAPRSYSEGKSIRARDFPKAVAAVVYYNLFARSPIDAPFKTRSRRLHKS